MTATALGLVLIAAVFHALWNLMAERAGGGPAFVWLYGTTSAVLLSPLAVALFFVGHPQLSFMGM